MCLGIQSLIHIGNIINSLGILSTPIAGRNMRVREVYSLCDDG